MPCLLKPIRSKNTGCRLAAIVISKPTPSECQSEGMYCRDYKGGQALTASALFCTPAGHGRREIAEAVYAQMCENDYTPHFQLATGSFELAERVARPSLPMNHGSLPTQGQNRSIQRRRSPLPIIVPAVMASGHALSAVNVPIRC